MVFKSIAKVCGAIGLAASFAFFNSALAQNLPLQGVTLRVGVSPTAPFVKVGESFQDLSGIDVDIIKELQRRTGFTLANNRIHITNFADLQAMGRRGDLDILAGAISLNKERAKVYHQSVPTFRSHTVLVATNGAGIRSVNDMGGRTLANIAGTSVPVALDPSVASSMKIKEEFSVFMTFYAVSKGEADAIFIDAPMAQDAINSWGRDTLTIAQKIEGTESDIGLMFKKDSKYSDVLDETLDQMREDGTVAKIIYKHLPGYDLPEDLKPDTIRVARLAREQQQYSAVKSYTNQPNSAAQAL